MSVKKYFPTEEFKRKAHIKSWEEYKNLYRKSIENPEEFWGKIAEELCWFKKWDKVLEGDKMPDCKWFVGGKLNPTYNSVNRWVKSGKGNKTALIWENEDGSEIKKYTFSELQNEISKAGNILKKFGVKKGDQVAIYMPMIPEFAIAILACGYIGASFVSVFGGMSPEALRYRINDLGCKVLITADGGLRRGKVIPLKNSADEALKECPTMEKVLVVKRGGNEIDMKDGRDYFWHELMNESSSECAAKEMDAEDTLFVFYTSGTTGKPKGIVHTIGGYTVVTYLTNKYAFDIHENDIYWCTADMGWLAGLLFTLHGALLNGVTTVMFEGTPEYPTPGRWWEIIERHKVTFLHTSPTAIRLLMKFGSEWPERYDLSSLRLIGSVGEPINPAAWEWYYKYVGKERCPIADTWGQTEINIAIMPMPGAMPMKPGSAYAPFFGTQFDVVKEDGTTCGPNEEGHLILKNPWPSLFRSVWKDETRYRKYFRDGFYYTDDSAVKDEEGSIFILGRMDDVIKVSGHRIGGTEIEKAMTSYPGVVEAGAVGMPDSLTGEAIFVAVVLEKNIEPTKELIDKLIALTAEKIGKYARPKKIHFTAALPKTRSGKVMRRLIKKIAAGMKLEAMGDISALANPEVIKTIIDELAEKKA